MPFTDSVSAISWLVAGLVLLILEILAPGVFMMWLGMAAIATGLVALLADMAFGTQVGVFAVFAAIGIIVGLRLRQAPKPQVNTQVSGVVGRTAVALAFNGREGRVRLGDSDWSARLAHGVATPEPGTRLRVDGVDGTILVVRPDS
jgi:hypothetical protein